jgi:hypothetical protein
LQGVIWVNHARLQHAPVPTREQVLVYESSHAISRKALINLLARVARLANLNEGSAQLPHIS